MAPAISVICPIYKAEKYLNRCLQSIQKQSFTDFEVIMVDDGSPDSSGEICDLYSDQDSRFKSFHIKNHGVSYARQYGVDHATGEYVIHADPDDWMEKEHLEMLYDEAVRKDADVVFSDFWVDVKGSSNYRSESTLSSVKSNNELISKLINFEVFGALWNKLIKRSIIKSYHIKFPDGAVLWEDLFVVCKILQNPVTWSYLPSAYYHYDCTSNENSLVRTVTKKSVISQLLFIKEFEQYCNQNGLENDIYVTKCGIKENCYSCVDFSSQEKRGILSEINTSYIRNNRFNLREPKKLALSLFLLGVPYGITQFIYRALLKIR